MDQEAIRGFSEDEARTMPTPSAPHTNVMWLDQETWTCTVPKLAEALRALRVSTNPSRGSPQPPNLLRGLFCRPTEADVQQQLRTSAPIGLQPPWAKGPHSTVTAMASKSQRGYDENLCQFLTATLRQLACHPRSQPCRQSPGTRQRTPCRAQAQALPSCNVRGSKKTAADRRCHIKAGRVK